MKLRAIAQAATLAVCTLLAGQASAQNLVVNGDFETNTGVGQLGAISTVAGWTPTGAISDSAPVGFNFILNTTADDALNGFSGGFPSTFSPGAGTNIFVWGPDNGVNNGFTGSSNGGYFMGGDGGYATQAFQQQINGLTVGQQYTLSFEWAGAQFTDVTGDYWVGWDVTFGSDSFSVGGPGTGAVASRGFRPWEMATTTFTASSTSEFLTFLATGPSGLPPFSLLDGVSLTPVSSVPEPASLALMLGGGLMVAAKRRRDAKRAAA